MLISTERSHVWRERTLANTHVVHGDEIVPRLAHESFEAGLPVSHLVNSPSGQTNLLQVPVQYQPNHRVVVHDKGTVRPAKANACCGVG